jgi:hypothetical protein
MSRGPGSHATLGVVKDPGSAVQPRLLSLENSYLDACRRVPLVVFVFWTFTGRRAIDPVCTLGTHIHVHETGVGIIAHPDLVE